MSDRIIMSRFFFVIFCGSGILTILFPEFMVKTSSSSKHQKEPTKDIIYLYKIGAYISIFLGLIMIAGVWMGGLVINIICLIRHSKGEYSFEKSFNSRGV